jgi:hypothetical protein
MHECTGKDKCPTFEFVNRVFELKEDMGLGTHAMRSSEQVATMHADGFIHERTGNIAFSVDLSVPRNTTGVVRVNGLDLSSFCQDKFLSDVTVRTTDGKEIPAHKLVLALHSPVLKARFEHGMRDATEKIEFNATSTVAQVLLRFCYSKHVPLCISGMRDDDVLALLEAAHFYEINELLYLAVQAMTNRITAENAAALLKFSMMFTPEISEGDGNPSPAKRARVEASLDDADSKDGAGAGAGSSSNPLLARALQTLARAVSDFIAECSSDPKRLSACFGPSAVNLRFTAAPAAANSAKV